MPDYLKYRHLQTWPPDVLERALRASGYRGVGNRIPGTQVLMEHLRSLGPTPASELHRCFETMTSLQELAVDRCHWTEPSRLAPRPDVWIRYRLALANLAYKSHLPKGDVSLCPCIWCRIWRMWMEDYEEAMSEW